VVWDGGLFQGRTATENTGVSCLSLICYSYYFMPCAGGSSPFSRRDVTRASMFERGSRGRHQPAAAYSNRLTGGGVNGDTRHRQRTTTGECLTPLLRLAVDVVWTCCATSCPTCCETCCLFDDLSWTCCWLSICCGFVLQPVVCRSNGVRHFVADTKRTFRYSPGRCETDAHTDAPGNIRSVTPQRSVDCATHVPKHFSEV